MNKFNELYAPPDYLDNAGNKILGEATDRKILEFIHTNNDKSKSFLRSNRGWKSAEVCMSIYYGEETDKIPVGLSKASVKKLRRQAREAIANATNIRPRWEHRSYKDLHAKQTDVFDLLRDDWWYGQAIDRKLKASLQFAGGGSTGYLFLWPDFDPATGELEIQAHPLNWKQVLPYHAGVDATIDSVYGITVWREMSVPEAHAVFPKHISIIQADRNVMSSFTKRWESVRKVFKGVYDRMKNRNIPFAQDPYPAADIFYSWIRDLSINETGRTILMGEAGAHYSYKVPSKWDANNKLNKVAPDGNIISSNHPDYEKCRFITDKECRLFPYQRMMITSNYGVIYDGPPLYLNRFRPIVPFKFEEVVGEFLGINLIRDGRRLEESTNNMLRAIEDAIVGKINPPIAISDKIPKPIRATLKRGARYLIGKTFEYNPVLMEKAIATLIDSDYYNLDPKTIEIIKYNQDMSDYLMGTNDSSFITKLNQMPGADTQEAYLRSLGALSTDHARGIELSILQIARVWLDFVPQVYTVPRILIKYSSVDLVAEADDFDPNSIIPDKDKYKNCSYAERWQRHMRNFTIYATPFSLQENISQTNRLILMTLQKIGVPISNKKLYDTFIPDGKYQIVYDEWKLEQKEKAMLAADLQRQLALANQAADPQNQIAEGLKNLLQENPQGRPNTFDKSPQIESKSRGGVPDSTVTTS